MSMKFILFHYDVPAKRGGRVRYSGGDKVREGTIKSAKGAHLMVRLDGDVSALKLHPTWMIEYLHE